MTVAAGDALYFRINRRAGTTYDGTSWDPSVEYLAGGAASVRWVVTDHLGTPRMAADQSGALAGVSRHDYLPFGKELPAGVGGRTSPTTTRRAKSRAGEPFAFALPGP